MRKPRARTGGSAASQRKSRRVNRRYSFQQAHNRGGENRVAILIDMPEQNEYTQRAIARLFKRIEAQEKKPRAWTV
jgi:hypothetical protein